MGRNAARRVALAYIRDVFADGVARPCEYCGHLCINGADRQGLPLATADHRLPLSRGGRDVVDNVAIACASCNSLKGPLTADEFARFRRDAALLTYWRDTVTLSLAGRGVRRQHVREDRDWTRVPGSRSVDRELRREQRLRGLLSS